MMIVRVLVALCASALSLAALTAMGSEPGHSVPEATQESVAYVLWVGANAPGRADHEEDVIRRALERTVGTHGPFELQVSSDSSLSGRWRQVLAEGDRIHVVPTSLMDFPPAELTLIPVPIAGGKLGYRNLIVQKDRLGEFTGVKGVESLSQFTAAQGRGWPDMWVYEANDLPIVGGYNMEHIFQLLAEGAVDYLPLGIEETPAILEKYSELSKDFAIVPELLVYYPLSSFPVVSNKRPELIERLRIGLEAMHADGTLGDTGRSAFKFEKPEKCRVITLENPSRLFPMLK
ncbi:hypothetical protein QWI17_10320 [Gilvimarinus sp. SDUM040013]|uniref:Solute-binding protein family 3/N-terminal domain-containing protein n=1 Tax=Gilvimarinus gilvus TaxID=3058038 RepID=A0ABU4S1S2_9GAMM|nr:hypothetical protein [Gilvimarinus sp. SDUM040013]MDO3386232.1 hypothetical protein [Gilvimarinus sp. SDUM040013]MDX6849773.1 hypothetical protein [Gilvimarinus sp. SDUM040013]